MKKLFLALSVFTLSTAAIAQKKADDVAKFTMETIDQGKLLQNKPEDAKFVITNISKEPLIIEQANPTCGCTMGDYTKSPIAPGATGYITARFNAASPGHFEKHLTVKFAGVDEIKSITIKGDVLNETEYAAWKAANPAPTVVVTDKAKTVGNETAAAASGKTAKVKTAKVAKAKGKKKKDCVGTNC
ncbi:MAG: DUF1573 domain-containing protein [Ferruginibacter sp.]|nr:DUF1573 domain-containing protein [Ferruginibacter sp.]